MWKFFGLAKEPLHRLFMPIGACALVMVLTLPLVSCSRNVSGTYEGQCENLTYGGKARMILMLHQDGTSLGGELSLHGDLGGGGPISGRIDGNTITFTTKDLLTGTITWTGKIHASRLVGQYQVEPPTLTTALTGVASQVGAWEVNRK